MSFGAEQDYPQTLGKLPTSISLRKRVEMRKQEHEKQLELINEMLKFLDENPAIEKFQDLVHRTHI